MDMLPMDVNVTFFFDYVQGTIETIEIINMTDAANTSLGQYQRLVWQYIFYIHEMQACGQFQRNLMLAHSESIMNFPM